MKRLIRLATAAAVALVMVGAARVASAGAILIVVADDASTAPDAELLARGYTTVDVFSTVGSTPTLAQLQAYDAVLAYTNFIPLNPSGLGDVLADYVDGGGQLTLATYAMSDPWAITGRIATSGYAPLTNLGTNGDVSGNLVATAPGDPIFSGVTLAGITYFHNSNFAQPGLDAGAALLATDGAINMIARSANGRVVGMNLFPSTGYGNDDEFYDLLANSLAPSNSVPEPATWSMMGLGLALLVARRRVLMRK